MPSIKLNKKQFSRKNKAPEPAPESDNSEPGRDDRTEEVSDGFVRAVSALSGAFAILLELCIYHLGRHRKCIFAYASVLMLPALLYPAVLIKDAHRSREARRPRARLVRELPQGADEIKMRPTGQGLVVRANGQLFDLTRNRICNGSHADSVGEWVPLDEYSKHVGYDYNNISQFLKYIKKEVLIAYPFGCLDDCAPGIAKNLALVRSNGCARLSTYDSIRMLLDTQSKMIFLGDSTIDQLYKGFRWVAKQMKEMPRMGRMLESHILFCIPETHELMHASFVSLGIYQKEVSDPPRNESLVIGFGNWYNYVRENLCKCKPEISLDDCKHVARNVETGNGTIKKSKARYELWKQCMRHQFSRNGRKFGYTTCAALRMDTCGVRRAKLALTTCDWRLDVLRLARYLEANREHLPRNIFWLEPSPTHIGKSKTASLDWRNPPSHTILKTYAPHVKILHQYDIFVPRNDSHCIARQGNNGPRVYDPIHYCYHSSAFEEYLGNVVSAVAAGALQPQGLVPSVIDDVGVET